MVVIGSALTYIFCERIAGHSASTAASTRRMACPLIGCVPTLYDKSFVSTSAGTAADTCQHNSGHNSGHTTAGTLLCPLIAH